MIVMISFDQSPDYLNIIVLKAIKLVNAFFVFGTAMVKFHQELQIVCKKNIRRNQIEMEHSGFSW